MDLQQIDYDLQFYKHEIPFFPLSIVNKHKWNKCIRGLCAFIVMCFWFFTKVSCWMHCF
jgi:hypothetical protein